MKFASLFSLAAVSFILSSCLEIKSTIIANKDGTATIEEVTLLGAQLTAMMHVGGRQEAQIRGLVMDKPKAEERAKKLGEGVTVKSYEKLEMPDGRSGAKVVFAVPHLSKLHYLPFEPEQSSKTPTKKQPMTFALSGKTLTITNPEADIKRSEGGSPQKDPEEMAHMKERLDMMRMAVQGMRITVEIKGEAGIASSDATHFKDGTISYLDIQFDKLTENAEVFAEVMESDDEGGTSMSDMATRFNKVDGFKIEGKKVITAELK